jgi:hypothetical protein
MRAVLWVLIYLILGGIHLVFTWDDDVDDFYEKLKAPRRPVFVAGSVILWLPIFLRTISGWLRRRQLQGPEERF